MPPTKFLRLVSIALLALAPALADVRLASPFTDHMVLQREMKVPVWGAAEPGEKVVVEFANQRKRTKGGEDGRWIVVLDPMSASSDARKLVVRGSKTAQPVQVADVLVGEVWLASGQSNMDFRVSKKFAAWAGVENEAQEIAAANFPGIRVFTADPIRANTPQDRVPGEWKVCSPETVPNFSAIAYFFARDLNRELKVPVGVVVLSYGASCAQAWIRRSVIAADPLLKEQLDRYDEQVKNYTPASEEELAAWKKAVEEAKAQGKRGPKHPRPDPVQDQHNPTVLFNGVVAPMIPYAVRGVLWYQGESITAPKELFPRWNETLIKDWRRLWVRNPETMPFYFCQLAALDNNSNSPQVREWQAEALRLPNTAMVVTIDIGDRKDVHPHNKQEVGARLARLALARDYGRKIEWSGPRLESATAENHGMTLKFSRCEGGLVAKGGPLKTFEICGEDGQYFAGDATIDGDTVFVSSVYVSEPAAVRYAWSNYPEGCNLYNAAGLPAAPFRSR